MCQVSVMIRERYAIKPYLDQSCTNHRWHQKITKYSSLKDKVTKAAIKRCPQDFFYHEIFENIKKFVRKGFSLLQHQNITMISNIFNLVRKCKSSCEKFFQSHQISYVYSECLCLCLSTFPKVYVLIQQQQTQQT